MKKHLPLAAMLVIALSSFCFAQPEPEVSGLTVAGSGWHSPIRRRR